MRIIDATKDLDKYFHEHHFDLLQYQRYINEIIADSFDLFKDDIAQYDFDQVCRPIINSALKQSFKLEMIRNNFLDLTKDLDQKINQAFDKGVDATIILYLGLCNGAGWATEIDGQDYVLLGVEKIMELDWIKKEDMIGLIYHELGHIYQKQYGILERHFDQKADSMLWQLFIEGIAMVFEQTILNDKNYYHQDKKGWKVYLKQNFEMVKNDFALDLQNMANDRYFGDWCNYHGYGDVGYYLGARFIYFILKQVEFDKIINFDMTEVKRYWNAYLKRTGD